ncbi:MAG: FkbM family methyltransferase [Bacteroidota bacterium]
MNIRSLALNIIDSIQTTSGAANAVKKLRWLYNRSGNQTQIKFSYPAPIGHIDLLVRSNQGSDAFIVSEVFEQQCYRVSLNNDITCIIDLGANAGFTAVYFSKFFPRATIACVEPMPGNISVLKKNLALNRVNAILFEAAAAINDEQILMAVGDKDYANKVHDIPFGKSMSSDTLAVDGLSMATILQKLNWRKVDLLKIDIEGYEGILLTQNNTWLENVETIIMEIHEGVTLDTLKNATDNYGFIHTKLQKGNWVLSKKVTL